ncbi:hypothetical protein BYT27DRAFT_6455382 [Phlegmacium glaucopus]|nr:hypothetical protein BYT27DRAFT_6455382 [Phlegmacium glaucopus]
MPTRVFVSCRCHKRLSLLMTSSPSSLIASPESVGVWLPLSCASATNRSMSALPRDPRSRNVPPHEICTGRCGMEPSASSQDVLSLVVCFHIMLVVFFCLIKGR